MTGESQCFKNSHLLPVFMWRSHIPKFKTAFPSEVLVSSDYQIYNVLARQGSSFCNRARLNFHAFCVAWLKCLPEKAVVWVKKWVIALFFAHWTILVVEEIFISTCLSSWVIRLRFNSSTQRQMFLLLYGGHVCAPPRGTNMASPYKAL